MNKNLNENTLKILELFTNFDKSGFYIREASEKSKMNLRTVKLNLDKLEKKNVLKYKNIGKSKVFSLDSESKEYVLLAEQFKKIKFLEKNPKIREIISKISNNLEGIGIIFGSYAKNLQKKDSDLDMFVIGNYNEKKIDELSKIYNIEINIKKYSKKEFKKNLNNDFLVKEILKNHIIFLNIEEFLNIIYENGKY